MNVDTINSVDKFATFNTSNNIDTLDTLGPWSWGTHLVTILHTVILITCMIRLDRSQNQEVDDNQTFKFTKISLFNLFSAGEFRVFHVCLWEKL